MRRKVQFRISDETGANVSSVAAYALRAGANVTSGGDTNILASGGTGTVRVTHPGMLKSGDKVYWRTTGGTLSDELVLTANPTYNASGFWEVSVRNDTNTVIAIGVTGRLVLVWNDTDHWVTVYTQDSGGSSASGVISINSNGEAEFFVEEPDVDIAITQDATLDSYRVDIPTEQRDFVTVEEFGAVGDGSTDDSAAFQAAVDYSVLNDLGPIQLEAKTYIVNTAIDISDTVYLKGKTSNKNGTNLTKVARTGTNKLLTVGGTSGNNLFRVRIEDIWFSGGDTDEVMLDFTYCSFLHLARLKVNGTTNYGMSMTTCWEVFIDDCDFSFLGDTGGTYAAVLLEDCNNMRWRGCHFESLRGRAIKNTANGGDSGSEICNLIFFDDCKFESSTSVYPAIHFNTVTSIYIRGGVFSQARSGSTSTCSSFIDLDSCRWVNIQTEMTFLSSDPGVSTPDLTNFIALDSVEGAFIDINILQGQDKITGTEMVSFTNNDETEAHQFVRVNYLFGTSPTAARTNLAGAQIQDSTIKFNDQASQIATYAGSPNSNVTGDLGDLCLDTTNGELYYKDSGASTNTGWVAVVNAGGFTATGVIDMDGNNLELGTGQLTDDTQFVEFQTHYCDVHVPLTIESDPSLGLTAPDWAQIADNGSGSTGIFLLHFDAGTEEEVIASIEMPHGYVEGSSIFPRITWAPTTTNGGDVVWGLEYAFVGSGDAIGNTTLITVTDTAGGTADTLQNATMSAISGTGKTIEDVLIMRIYRDATAGGDTYTGDAALLSFDLGIQCNSIGSDSLNAKS